TSNYCIGLLSKSPGLASLLRKSMVSTSDSEEESCLGAACGAGQPRAGQLLFMMGHSEQPPWVLVSSWQSGDEPIGTLSDSSESPSKARYCPEESTPVCSLSSSSVGIGSSSSSRPPCSPTCSS